MEKQKRKNKETERTASQLRGTGLAISFALLSVPIFCGCSFTLITMTFNSLFSYPGWTAHSLAVTFSPAVVATIGIITAIGTAHYTTKVMKLYRLSGVVSLTTIMSASVMIVTYLIASRIWAIAS